MPRPPHGNWNNGFWNGHFWGFHAGWLHGSWAWRTRPWFWTAGIQTGGWLVAPGETFVYVNPFVVTETTVTIESPVDYAEPLPPPPESAPAEGNEPDPVTAEAIATFDNAREAFRRRDYRRALERVDAAIKMLPSDATLHEFRALTLFASAAYPQAAETIYAVLAVGPGWTWETVRDLYGDPADYTTQLRAFEAYVGKNPDQSGAHFLAAYHYLMVDSVDAAIRELEKVKALSPKDVLAAELHKALTTPPPAGP